MEPQLTAVRAPIQLQIADDIRVQIERGDLAPGDSLPALHELAERWHTSIASARSAIALLKQQGLITGGRGKAPVVRSPHRRIVRSSDRHQVEKDLVLRSEEERRKNGAAEIDLGVPLNQLDFVATYDVIDATDVLAEAFKVAPTIRILRRLYTTDDRTRGHRQSWSVSYVPYDLISGNPDLLTSDCEPWPGGTLHQLHTVGIEVVRIIDEVSAAMPTTAEVHQWGMDDGVPLLLVRRISIDTTERVVEISDARYPADRTELQFSTQLAKW